MLEMPGRKAAGRFPDACQQGGAIVGMHRAVDRPDAGGDLRPAQAVDGFDAFAEIREAALLVRSPAELEQHTRYLRGDLPELQLQVFLMRQVVGADDVAAQQFELVMNRRDVQQYRHLAAVTVQQAPFAHRPLTVLQRRDQHLEAGFDLLAPLFGENRGAAGQCFLGEQRGGQRMAHQHPFGVAEQLLGCRVETADPAIEAGDQHRAGGAVEQGLLQCDLLGIVVRLQAFLEQAHHLAAESLERIALLGAQLSGLAIDHAQGAQVVAIGRGQRGARIETDVGLASDQRVVRETRIAGGVGYLENAFAFDGVGAEGNLPWCFADVQAEPALEPLAMLVDQRNQRDGGAAEACRQLRDVIEGGFVGGVEDFVAQQRGQARQLARGGWDGCWRR